MILVQILEYLQPPPKFQDTQRNAPEIWRILEDHVYRKNGCLENFEHFLLVTGYVKPEKRSHPGFLDLSSWLRMASPVPWLSWLSHDPI